MNIFTGGKEHGIQKAVRAAEGQAIAGRIGVEQGQQAETGTTDKTQSQQQGQGRSRGSRQTGRGGRSRRHKEHLPDSRQQGRRNMRHHETL